MAVAESNGWHCGTEYRYPQLAEARDEVFVRSAGVHSDLNATTTG